MNKQTLQSAIETLEYAKRVICDENEVLMKPIDKSIQDLRQALSESANSTKSVVESKALAQPEPVHAIDISQERVHKSDKHRHEPVAWHEPGAYGNVTTHKDWAFANGWEPLYAAPREWVGLTDEEFLELAQTAERGNYLTALRRMEAKLKEKNT
jgi:hypothetical protein